MAQQESNGTVSEYSLTSVIYEFRNSLYRVQWTAPDSALYESIRLQHDKIVKEMKEIFNLLDVEYNDDLRCFKKKHKGETPSEV